MPMNEASHKRTTLHNSTLVKQPEEANPQRQKADQWLPVAGGEGGEQWLRVCATSIWGDEKVLQLDSGDVQHYE